MADNVFDPEMPFPLPAFPPLATRRVGLGTYFSGILGRYFTLSASCRM
ncbi:MAG: hypothetical protein ACJ8R9_18875 [Steroidobacteraceae bacterium]